MAANPLPKNPIIPVYIANAATALDVTVVPGQTIEWQNDTTSFIHIQVQTNAINGKHPLTDNDFQVPAKGSIIGTKQNAVKVDAQPGDYPFTRGFALGGGKIIVQANR